MKSKKLPGFSNISHFPSKFIGKRGNAGDVTLSIRVNSLSPFLYSFLLSDDSYEDHFSVSSFVNLYEIFREKKKMTCLVYDVTRSVYNTLFTTGTVDIPSYERSMGYLLKISARLCKFIVMGYACGAGGNRERARGRYRHLRKNG